MRVNNAVQLAKMQTLPIHLLYTHLENSGSVKATRLSLAFSILQGCDLLSVNSQILEFTS